MPVENEILPLQIVPPQFAQECIGNDMLGLLKVLGKSCYALVGHDWGAILVWHLACLFPEAFPRSLTGKSSFWCRFVP